MNAKFGRRYAHPKGQTIIIVVLSLVIIMVIAGMVIDLGMMHREKAQMQAAADAAALAGAEYMPDGVAGREAALDILSDNGYVEGENGVISIETIPNPDGHHPQRFQVIIRKRMPHRFAAIFGFTKSILPVDAMATFTASGILDIYGDGQPGIGGIQNLSLFGPFARYSYGDPYSTKYLDNGAPNPLYRPEGYNFTIYVAPNYLEQHGNLLQVDLFDPETWNIGNKWNAGPNAIDEIRRAPGGEHPQPENIYTTTQFTLYAPDGTQIAQAVYGPDDDPTETDLKWVTPEGFTVDVNTFGPGNYRLNVKSIDGSSENGFDLRAGPPLGEGEEFEFVDEVLITAAGTLPINFNLTGTVNITLGFLPTQAAGGKVFITKFDTDVGAKEIVYYDELGNEWPGELAGNGYFKVDAFELPEDYPGSILYARYRAGCQDTSVWEMRYEATKTGPGELLLID
ncbi:MAG TPA: hypothetical protein EYP85_04190 [Armatimonadetes bacterium]|nr:hypothetical protein [Armatimonadota bacterium]